MPIAIQLFQEPSENNPIWTPGDTRYDWLLAKMWFRNADHQVHQVSTRMLGRIHPRQVGSVRLVDTIRFLKLRLTNATK